MDDLLQKTVTKVVTLTNATTARFTASILEQVGDLTNSVLELDEAKTKVSDQLMVVPSPWPRPPFHANSPKLDS